MIAQSRVGQYLPRVCNIGRIIHKPILTMNSNYQNANILHSKRTLLFCLFFGLFNLALSAQVAKTDSSLFLCVTVPPSKGDTGKRVQQSGSDCPQIENDFNDEYAKNCYYKDSMRGNAVTARYMVDFDQRTGKLTYLKFKNARGREYLKVKKQVRPLANTEMFLKVVARGGDYRLRVESGDYFMEYEADFAKSIQNGQKTNNAGGGNTEQGKQGSEKNKTAILQLDNSLETGLFSLEQALFILNNRYPVNSIINGAYYRDLSCLRFSISEYFGIPIFVNDLSLDSMRIEASMLAESLKALVLKATQKDTFGNVIFSIASQYYSFIGKQIVNYREYFTQIQVPDHDYFDMHLVDNTSSKNPDVLLTRHFRVPGGFKIDFSAGIFLTGLAVPEFVAKPHTFKYKRVMETVDPQTGAITTTYLELRDTVGNLIHTKNPKMNYAAGFMSHAYVRSGLFANCGIATGLLVNNDGFQMLLGGSILLNIRKSRLAFSGGMALGQRKTLSPVVQNSVWKDAYLDVMPDNLPQFFTGSDVPYYLQWNRSWFFGMTYNFSSVAIRW